MQRMSSTGLADRGLAQRGFTLVELLIVLTLSLVMAAVLAYSVRPRSISFTQQVDRIAMDLRILRSSAIRDRMEQEVEIDVSNNLFIFPDHAVSLDEGVGVSITGSENRLIGPGRIGLVFFPDGSSTGAVIRLNLGEEQRAIVVNWISGRVTLNVVSDRNASTGAG